MNFKKADFRNLVLNKRNDLKLSQKYFAELVDNY